MFLLSLTCGLAFLLSLSGVPIARQAALKYGIVDAPDGQLKQQREPVPYFGGLAIYLAFLMSLAFTFEFRQDVLGIVLSGTIVVMLGLIDDFGVLTPWTKLSGQLLAVFVLSKSGITDVYASAVTGNVGTSPITGAALLLSCSEVTGRMFVVRAAGPACAINDATNLTAPVRAMDPACPDPKRRGLP